MLLSKCWRIRQLDALCRKYCMSSKKKLEFNENIADDFASYKKQEDEHYKQLRMDLGIKVERDEQHSRLSNVRIFGVPERDEGHENTAALVAATLTEKLGVTIDEADIDIAHKLPER